MGLFDDLLSNKSKATSTNSSGSTQTQIQDQNTNTTGSTNNTSTQGTTSSGTSNTLQTNTSTAAGKTVTQNLDQGTQDLLKSLLPVLSAHAANPDGATLATSLSQILATDALKPAVSAEDIAGQQSAARTSFNQNEAVNIGQLQSNIGSKNNTYSALVNQKGQQDLSSTLAGIVANAGAVNKQSEQQGLTAAISGLTQASGIGSSSIDQLMKVVAGLTGATTISDTGQTISGSTNQSTSTSSNDLVQAIQSVITQQQSDQQTAGSADATSTSNTTGTQKDTPSILSLFMS